MATAYIPSWGSKDPDDKRPKRFDAAGVLAQLGDPDVLSVDVFVDASGVVLPSGVICSNDGALIITGAVYDPTKKLITFVWAGGTPGKTYLVTCRLHLGPDWRVDQSASVTIAPH